MSDGLLTLFVAVLAFALGIFTSHATLGNKITRALTLIEPIPLRLDGMDKRLNAVEIVHFHRRSTDQAEYRGD